MSVYIHAVDDFKKINKNTTRVVLGNIDTIPEDAFRTVGQPIEINSVDPHNPLDTIKLPATLKEIQIGAFNSHYIKGKFTVPVGCEAFPKQEPIDGREHNINRAVSWSYAPATIFNHLHPQLTDEPLGKELAKLFNLVN